MPRPSQGPQLRANSKRSGLFYIYWTDPTTGRSRERTTGTRERGQAHQIFADFLATGEHTGTVRWNGPRRAAQAGIAEVLDIYSREYAAEHTASPKTTGYSIKALLRWWGERTCDFIRPETCRAYVKAREEAGAQASTAGRELTVLRAALGYAVTNGKLVDRPFVEIPSRPPGRDRWLTRSEVAKLLWESRRDPQARLHLPLFILLALATGARSGALFELRWTQIDFDHDRINFNPPGRQQTSKRRPIISIPRRLRWFLLQAHARASSPYVLAYQGKQIGSIKKSFRAARDRAGLGDDVVPYTLRHTAGTWMAQAGVDLWMVGGWLGHTQQRTTELYAHHSPDFLRAARKVMD